MLRALMLVACGVGAAAAHAEDWPHWRGPSRDGHSAEASGFNDGKWLDEKPVWTINVGAGGSSPIVVGETVYFLGWSGGKDHLQAVDLKSGKKLWTSSYESPQYARHATGDEGLYRGPSSTPEFDLDTGIVYTLSLDGELRAHDSKGSEKLVWRRNLYDEYQMPQRPRIGRSGRRDYGYTTAPLVHGEWLIVEAGGN
ncbi:MAG TPA: PQQ-binding-like beta-propeller repeat protein, partial [Pirellulaceae bacterium]|nr:PQQ-binding-like beta-propeller repeat protein [Pirellulaceae bacterium]